MKSRYETGIQKALQSKKIQPILSRHFMEITFHHSRNADFVSRMDGVKKIDACTIRIEKEKYRDLYSLMRFVIKVCNAYV